MDCRSARARNPDEWLALCSDLSRPIVAELRDLIFRIEPDLTEAIKWNMLCFSGRKLVLALGGYKKKAGVTFFRGSELADPAGVFNQGLQNESLRGIDLAAIEQLDRRAFRELLHAAAELDRQPPMPRPPKPKRPPLPMPKALSAALKQHAKAAAGFAALSPSRQREYIAWITFAKRPETIQKRLKQTLAALSKGRKWAER